MSAAPQTRQAPDTPPVIEIRGLAKSFGANKVLDGVDLSLARGESLVVIGGSGSGKSVLLRLVLGLEAADRGEVLLHGAPADARLRARFMQDFGMLFQSGALFDSLPVWRNVGFRLLREMPAAKARERAIASLSRVGLGPEVADRMPADLSGGMRKRVALARAIATDPAVLFFDEPTAGLDPQRATAISELIRGIVTQTGATAITITHDMRSVRTIADRVALLDRGRIRWQGPVTAPAGGLDSDPDPVLRAFVEGRPLDPGA